MVRLNAHAQLVGLNRGGGGARAVSKFLKHRTSYGFTDVIGGVDVRVEGG